MSYTCAMGYYARMGINSSSPDFDKVLDVGRWYTNEDGDLSLERWTGKGWEDWPRLYDASGTGGANPFLPITEEQAKRHMQDSEPRPLSKG